jgi:hypothetical protein
MIAFILTRWRQISSCDTLIGSAPLPPGVSAPDSMVRMARAQLSPVGPRIFAE